MNDQDGAMGIVVVLAVAVLFPMVGALLAGAGDVLVAAARARSAADAAALAGMAASPLVTSPADSAGGASPEAAARRIAASNGAGLTSSDVRGWPLRYRAGVEVAPRLAWVRRIVGSVGATATAAVRPRTPSAHVDGV